MENKKKIETAYYEKIMQATEEQDKEYIKALVKDTPIENQVNALKGIKEQFFPDRKPKVLIVDDEPHIVNLIKLTLQNDFEVIVAYSGNEALHKAVEQAPDIITMDIMMPGMSGFEVVEELKKYDDTKSIPVIFLSAKDKLADMYEGLDLGADDYITKPFEPEELTKRVKQALGR